MRGREGEREKKSVLGKSYIGRGRQKIRHNNRIDNG